MRRNENIKSAPALLQQCKGKNKKSQLQHTTTGTKSQGVLYRSG